MNWKKIYFVRLFSLFFLLGGVFLSSPVFSAGVGDIIYEGSGKEIDLSPYDVEVPVFTGNTGEEKVDRATLTVINIILYICGTAAGVMILVGGIRYTISAGDEDMTKGAKSTILWAMGGLVMTFLAWAIVLNVVRVGTLDERLDYSENPIGDKCGPNITMGCTGECCGCGALGSKITSCGEGLVCGGPKDVSGIKVCQTPAGGNDGPTRTRPGGE